MFSMQVQPCPLLLPQIKSTSVLPLRGSDLIFRWLSNLPCFACYLSTLVPLTSFVSLGYYARDYKIVVQIRFENQIYTTSEKSHITITWGYYHLINQSSINLYHLYLADIVLQN